MIMFKDYPEQQDFAVITLIELAGSVPQTLGAKAVVTAQGLFAGTVGGGKVEAKAIAFAQDLLANKNAEVCEIIEWNLTRDVGMTCGGVMKFLFEIRREKKWRLAVFGAGHVAQELVPLLTKLDCHVSCVDSRAEWLEKIIPAPNLELICSVEPRDLVKNFSDGTFFLLMTQGHSTDVPILAEILKNKQTPYVGVIGSRTKKLKIIAELKALGLQESQIENFICPVGLALGNSTPVEISFSIVAQLLQMRDALLKQTQSPSQQKDKLYECR